jgi:ABC-type branched-subunit amino acid transport system substrate-binding protein
MTKRNLAALVVLLVILVGAVVFAVVRFGGDDEDDGPAPAAAEDVSFDLRMGVVTSFTGDLSPFGEPIDRSARIAADLINESLERTGVGGVSVEIVATEDDQTEATAGVEAATKLVQTDNVQVIVGALASAVTTPIAESVAIPNGIVQISPASTSPALSDLDDNGFFWRTPPSDALQGRVLARAIADELGNDATINTGTRNDAYGTALTGVFEEAWREGGGTIGRSVRWNPEAATFDSEAQRLAGGNPDGWLVIDFPETWARVGPALVRAGGWDPARTFTADGLRNSELPGDVGEEATENMRGTAPTSEGAPAGEAFGRVFAERAQGVSRQTFDAQAFDAVMVGFLAALRGGSADSETIRDNLQDVSGPDGDKYTFEQLDQAIQALLDGETIDYEGASGPIDFDDNGDPSAALYEVWAFENGEIETRETFDFDQAEA